MSDLIDRAEALKCLEFTGDYNTLNEIYERLSKLPSISDTVSGATFEQVMWERNLAIKQLEDLGYGLGEKPKTGHWYEEKASTPCEVYLANYRCSECHEYGGTWMQGLEAKFLPRFCMWCGARMGERSEENTRHLEYAGNCADNDTMMPAT